ncbi:MAG: hypothetical protein MRK01_05205 [Candidatus Scalindua sp.]|nr:hypothetical protein [Candidatus Scalindua sp.]
MKKNTIILWIIYFLFPSYGWCALPDFDVVFSTSNNVIDVDNNKSESTVISHTSGGAVLKIAINGTPAFLVASFGQPFSGRAFSATAEVDLMRDADNALSTGSEFLKNENIYRKVLLDAKGAPAYECLLGADGVCHYSESDLRKAEELYRRLLSINPFVTEAVEGIINSRLATAKKGNIVWDLRRRDQLRFRLRKIGDTINDKKDILNAEIGILKQISDIQKGSIALLMELFSDQMYNGPGMLLRNEITLKNSEVVNETLKLIFSTATRYAEAELQLGQKRLLLNFFNQGESTNVDSRAFALSELAIASTYVTELIRLLNPYINDDLYTTSEMLRLASFQPKFDARINLIEQGYNPFGFLNEFVPFVASNDYENNLMTFSSIKSIAETAVNDAKDKEKEAEVNEDKWINFAKDNSDYEQRLVDNQLSYTQRIKSLVGTVIVNGAEEPDVYTFLFPDKDIDGDSVTERDKERENLRVNNGFEFTSKGQMSEQWGIIESGETRVKKAFNELEDVFRKIVIYEETGSKIAGHLAGAKDAIFNLIKENGEKTGVLIRQRGRLEAAAQREIGHQNQLSSFYSTIADIGGTVASVITPKKSNNGIGHPVTENSDSSVSNQPEFLPIAIAVGTAIVNGIAQYNAAGSSAKTLENLANDIANIDAEINEINYMERANIHAIELDTQKNTEIERVRQQVQLTMLEQANRAFDLSIAHRDLKREIDNLTNKIDEVGTLVSDFNRLTNLLKKHQSGLSIGWEEDDVRDVLTNYVLIADKAFSRAQVWCFIALRALDYYANKEPEANGQPNVLIKTLYERLYVARRAEDLSDLLTDMETTTKAPEIIFSQGSTSCGERGVLSLKYDVMVPTLVSYDVNGKPLDGGVNSEETFQYLDPLNGQFYKGVRAYQAVFREFLRKGLTKQNNFRKLNLTFGTDLFPRHSNLGIFSSNPFYVASATTAKVIGFSNSNCTSGNVQGIQLNLVGSLGISQNPRVRVSQLGNSYLKHTAWTINDFNNQRRLINPLRNMRVFSAYKQILPTWLIGDIKSTTIKERPISNKVETVFRALINNADVPGGRSLAFTDRSVANDRWEIVIDEFESSVNSEFFNKLEEMLNSQVSQNPSSEFLTDIQIKFGWAYRNP